MHITELQLMTHCLAQLKDFYTEKLELNILKEADDTVTFSVGATQLTFSQTKAEERPFYHFAYNIPSNKFALGKAWLASRCPLLEKDGINQITHKAWNAQSIYFHDPAGNIVELIARYNLINDRPGAFHSDDLLSVSEIGLVVDNVPATTNALKSALGEEIWKEQSDTFTALGNDTGLLILAMIRRIWLLTDSPAEIHPIVMTIQGATPIHYQLPRFPYQINIK